MAQAQTAKTATPAAKGAPKGKRAAGPLTISYIDASDKPHKRLPADPKFIVVTNLEGKTATFPVDDINIKIRSQLAAGFAAKRMETFGRNGMKKDGGDVLKLVTAQFENIKNGKLFARGEGAGAGAGRPFDFDVYIDAMEETSKRKKGEDGKVHPATPAQLEALRTKLESLTPKERRAKVQGWKNNDPIYAVALLEVQARKTKEGAKGKAPAGDALADLF